MFKRIILISAILAVLSALSPGTSVFGSVQRRRNKALRPTDRALYNEAHSKEDLKRAVEKM